MSATIIGQPPPNVPPADAKLVRWQVRGMPPVTMAFRPGTYYHELWYWAAGTPDGPAQFLAITVRDERGWHFVVKNDLEPDEASVMHQGEPRQAEIEQAFRAAWEGTKLAYPKVTRPLVSYLHCDGAECAARLRKILGGDANVETVS